MLSEITAQLSIAVVKGCAFNFCQKRVITS